MKHCLLFSALALFLLLQSPYSQGQQTNDQLNGASWIWHTPVAGETLGAFHAGARYFRAEMSVPESPALQSATIVITCDNLFVLYLNGRPVGESETGGSAWSQAKYFNLTGLLSPGRVVLGIEAINTAPGPAALAAKLSVALADGTEIILTSDATWKSNHKRVKNWEQPDFEDEKWGDALVLGNYGNTPPWNKVGIPTDAEPANMKIGKVHAAAANIDSGVPMGTVVNKEPPEGFLFPETIAYLGNDCSLYRQKNTGDSAYDSLNVTIFNPRNSRAFPEHDLPAPMKVGHTLMLLRFSGTAPETEVLFDAGTGAIGSPSVSFDGKWIYFSMTAAGESFFSLYRIPVAGGTPERLTEGPFFDIDPAELPDGRIVFTSTRIGTFEEYHSPPSRALFVMNADGSDIRAITSTIIFDNEPEVLADGRIIFIRSDNFFDRGKVETLLHATFPDGTHGYTEFGLDRGPEYGNRLRAYNCGSPAPMPDGRVAFVSSPGITLGNMGDDAVHLQNIAMQAGDVAALPDGRLLCTLGRHLRPERKENGKQPDATFMYNRVCVLDPDSEPPEVTIVFDAGKDALHSPVYVGARPRPPLRAKQTIPPADDGEQATGILFCQNTRFTKNTTAGWEHVRAIRVLAGKGLVTRSSHSYIVHAGNETVELGTVPLAPDGSFCIEVPADTPLALQAVDAEGRSELNEMSWIYVRPGEKRSCVGCHHSRQAAPLADPPRAQALLAKPLRLLENKYAHRFRGNNPAVTGLMELQFDRFREVAGINRYGEQAATSVATENEDVAELVTCLEQENTDRKLAAIQQLAIFRDPGAAPALTECLFDATREVRLAATLALASCGTRASVPLLLEALADPDPLVAQGAAIALENLTGHREPFNPFIVNGVRWKRAAPWKTWFTKNAWDVVENTLLTTIQNGDSKSIRRAAVALGHTGSNNALQALRNYVQQQEKHNPYPVWRDAGHKGDAARFNALSEVNPRTLQAVVRAIGYLRDTEAVPLLSRILGTHGDPETGNLFLAEAAAEALGRIGTPESETAMIEAFAGFKKYPEFTYWYGDHPALMSCHSSPIHYFIMKALDALGSTRAEAILPHIIRSVPIDPDRALLLPNDDYETLAGRIIRRHGAEPAVVETCLAILGDPEATASDTYKEAISTTIRCWGGHPGPENRAAQILSLVCRNPKYTDRIEAALLRYSTMNSGIERVFNTGIPVVDKLPVENWVCFYLARALGNIADPKSADTLLSLLENTLPEAASGRPDPLGPGVLFLHNDLTPCWRAAVVWALGRIGDPRAASIFFEIIRDLDNAMDTRHAAAVALGEIASTEIVKDITQLADNYPELSVQLALKKALKQLS